MNGIREYARRAGARVAYLPLDADLRIERADQPYWHALAASRDRARRLFAFPAQSNFSGVQASARS